MSYTIEIPKISDAIEIAKMHNQSWLDTYPKEELGIKRELIEERGKTRLSEEGLKRRKLAIKLAHKNSTYFLRIARDESGRIVGFIDGSNKNGQYWLDGLYTARSTYGTGLGKLLWESYLPWTHNNEILLTVATYNERAKSFYKKLGFIEKIGTERMFGDAPIPVIDMVRASK